MGLVHKIRLEPGKRSVSEDLIMTKYMLKLVTILTNLLSKRLLKLSTNLGEPNTAVKFITDVS